MGINKTGRRGPDEERPCDDVQFHSEGKEMALWVLIGVRCNMANFLFYKDHQAVMWILEKKGLGVGRDR